MPNTYRPVSDRAKALHGTDDLDLDLTAIEERDELDGGHLEIVPRLYKVLVNNFAAGEQGSTVELALPVENEKALLVGGILERDEWEGQPSGNASRDEWAAWALAHGATDEDLLGDDGEPLGRNELRDKFAK
jgi:hypothetical protein